MTPNPGTAVFEAELAAELAALDEKSRLRTTSQLHARDSVHLTHPDGRPLLSFSSNDYLGLSRDRRIAQAVSAAVTTQGTGSGGSRLVMGDAPAHRALEAQLAALVRQPDALVFPTGYQANLGVLTALAGRRDLLVSDAANHASIIDGCRLSRAQVVIYGHRDAEAAARALNTPGHFRRRLLVTESIFSMDGDRAPLPDLAAAAHACGAVLILDEAHALGIAGPGGAGIAPALGIQPHVTVGTLGKSFATLGGFAAGPLLLRQILVNTARSFVFTTGLPPLLAIAASQAIGISLSPEGQARRQHVASLAATLRAGLRALGFPTTGDDLILPIPVGTDAAAMNFAARLLARGLYVPAIRPPTVPEGTARLRITLSAAHSEKDVNHLLQAFADLVRP